MPGYWAAFGYQNHVIPIDDPRREGEELISLCGVITDPSDVGPRDDRPTCSVCSTRVRSGRFCTDPDFAQPRHTGHSELA